MDRREAIKKTAILMGGVLTAPTLSVFLESCSSDKKSTLNKGSGTEFTEDEKKVVEGMVDVIIPRTDTPGAVDAEVPAFIVMMMQETYPEEDQKEFHSGLAAFDNWCQDEYEESFLELSSDKQDTAVADLDELVLGDSDLPDDDLSFYRKLKELTLLGFFTSETGATETLRYVDVPGHYEGCVSYEKGDKAWAT